MSSKFIPTHIHRLGGEALELLGFTLLRRAGKKDIPVAVYRHSDMQIHVVKHEWELLPIEKVKP